MTPAKMTAGDMVGLLRRHYLQDNRPPGGIFAPEVQSPCGKRRADLLWLPLTGSAARGLVGHEIKVSRADVIAELRDPTKPDPWLRYCSYWWLVVADPAMCDGLDVPEKWGVMSPPSGRLRRSMTVHRKPTRLEPEERSAGIERVTAWLFWKQHDDMARLRQEAHYAARRADAAEQRERTLAASGGGYVSPERKRIADLVLRVEAALAENHVYGAPDDMDIIDAITDVTIARRAYAEVVHEVQAMMREARSIVSPFQSTYGALGRLLARHGESGGKARA